MDMAKKARPAISFLQKHKTPFRDSLSVLRQFENLEEALQSVGNCLDLEDDIQKFMLNYFIESQSDIQALPLKRHFIAGKLPIKRLF
jgi:hypothetical protein